MSSGPLQQPPQNQDQTLPAACQDEKKLVDALKAMKPQILAQVEAVIDYHLVKAQQALDACITANGGGKIAP